MKKLLFIALGSIVLSAMVFAKETVQNLDFSIPIDNRELDFDDDIGKITEKSTSFDFDYSMMTINESSFSFIFGANIGYTSTKFEKMDDPFEGFDLGMKLGWGGIPLNMKNFVLGFHGFFGFGFRTLNMSMSSVDAKLTVFNTKIGADLIAIYRFNDRVGVNASVDLFTNLPAFGSLDFDGTGAGEDHSFACMGGIGVVPKVGVSLFF